MLSAGVIKVMEVPRASEALAKPVVLEANAPRAGAWSERSLLASDPRLDLSGTLGVSVLDHEIQGPPEENVAREEDPETEAELEEELGPLSMRPTRVAPLPQPGTAGLVGWGLILLGGQRRYWTMSRSSISKASAAPGGIADCCGGVSP